MPRSRTLTLAILAGIGAALALGSRGAFASAWANDLSVVPIDEDSGEPDVGQIVADPSVYNEGFYEPWQDFEGIMIDDATPEQRLAAFLYMIRASEHRFPQDVDNDACYALFYSGIPFVNMSDHPVLTKELRGVRLSDAMCRDAGFGPGCVSTAAGAYQIIRPTWERVRASGAWGVRLGDFSKASQDEAARRILQMVGALDHVLAGDFESAIGAASTQWASLPKATANQNPRSWQFATARYNEALAGFA